MRTLFIILLSIWTLFSWYYYVCTIKQACWSNSSTTSNFNTKKIKPLKFRWSSYQIPLDSGFPALKDAILSQQEEGQILHITGHYFLSEAADEPDYDLGMARAMEVKKILQGHIPEEQIKTFTALSPLKDIPKDSLIEAIQYEWVEAPALEEETEPEGEEIITTQEEEETPIIPSSPEEEEVSESFPTTTDSKEYAVEGDYFIKYFPYNQTKIPAELSKFLDDLAARAIAENKKVIIRGHTDSSGDREMNFKVGLRRAKKIRDQLKQRGVARKNIETTSDGEDSPIASNKTKEGRQQNRRIEIILK